MDESTTKSKGRPPSNHRLVVWGERREKPDWDLYLSALLDYAMQEATKDDPAEPEA